MTGDMMNEVSLDANSQLRPITQRTRFQGALALAAIVTASNNGMQFQSIPVAESLLALAASVVLVSGATDAVERITSPNIPKYDVAGERFDQSTFAGRYCKMLLACDPRLLLYSKEEVRRYRSLAYDEWTQTQYDDRTLWEAKRIADSALHPTTQEWVPRPFRMSGYLPANGPICVAMIASTATLSLLFWSWMNQSQNAMINYFNGPRSEQDEDENSDAFTLIKSYGIAVASALTVAFGLATYVEGHYAGEEAAELLRFISFPSAVIASSLNCYIVRRPEIAVGVPLLNDKMEDVLPGQTSSMAAAKGVYSTTASRAVLQMPTYFFPPLILDTVTPLKQFMADNPTLVVPITTFLLLVSFGIGLPAAVGIFPQISCIQADEVEEKFQDLGYAEFYYNKGL